MCNSEATQLKAMTRLRNFMAFNAKEALISISSLCHISVTALWSKCFRMQNS